MTNQHIVIVNYGFPPNDGIGGRRWAKFAKGLVALGYRITVIAAVSESKKISPWNTDIQSDQIKVIYLPRKYPQWITNTKSGIFSGIQYRLAVMWIRQFEKGTAFDLAIFWKKQLKKTLQTICTDPVTNVIVTGAPFNLLYYAAQIKQEGLPIHLIADFRDPWLGAYNYGMANLTSAQEKVEIEKYNLVCENSDVILSPNAVLTDELLQLTKRPQALKPKFKTLSHFYDREDVFVPSEAKSKQKNLRFIYGGTLYSGTEKHLNKLNEQLAVIQAEEPEIYSRLELQFYTPESHLASIFEGHECVQFSKPIGKKIFEQAAKSTGLFLFYNQRNNDYPTSKIFEFLPYKTPFLIFSDNGLVINYIEERNWGKHITEDYPLIRFVKALEGGEVNFEFSDVLSFELLEKTKELTQWFRS